MKPSSHNTLDSTPNYTGCVMAKINANTINWFDINEIDGQTYEHEPHVTILYGLKEDPEIMEYITKLFKQTPPIHISFGDTKVFKRPGKLDVLYVEIISPTLHKISRLLSRLPNKNTFASYTPHMTIGYVKNGYNYTHIKIVGSTILTEIVYSTNNVTVTMPLGNILKTPSVDIFVKKLDPNTQKRPVPFTKQKHKRLMGYLFNSKISNNSRTFYKNFLNSMLRLSNYGYVDMTPRQINTLNKIERLGEFGEPYRQ